MSRLVSYLNPLVILIVPFDLYQDLTYKKISLENAAYSIENMT